MAAEITPKRVAWFASLSSLFIAGVVGVRFAFNLEHVPLLPAAWRLMDGIAAVELALSSIALLVLLAGGWRGSSALARVLATLVLLTTATSVAMVAFPGDGGPFPDLLPAPVIEILSRALIDTPLPGVLIALGLLALLHERRPWFGVSHWLGLSVISLSILQLASTALHSGTGPTLITPGTSLGYLLLGAALVCARIEGVFLRRFSRQEPVGYLALPLLGVGFGVPLLLYLLQAWWFLPAAPELHDTGLILAAVQSIVIFGMLTFALRRVDKLDQRRREAENTRDALLARLQQQAAGLELLVADRTRELHKTTERLDLALRAGGFGVWDWDLVSNHLYWDERQCAIYGYLPAEFDGSQGAWLARVHPEERDKVQAQLAGFFASAEHFQSEFRIVIPDGDVRHIQAHGFIRRDAAGRIVRIVGMDRDVTEAHAAARELSILNDRLRLAIQATGYGVWEMDVTSQRMIWDDRMLAIYGIAREEFTGATEDWHNRVLPEDIPADDQRIAEALDGRLPIYQSTFRILRPDGAIRHIEALGVVQRDRQGQAMRLVGLDRDITEASELREQLRITEERWRLALSGTNDGVWDWDIAGERIYRDARYAEMIGYKSEELPARQIWHELSHPDDIPAVDQAIHDHLEGRTAIYQCEYRLRHRSGRWIWVLGRGKVVARDPAGRALRMVGTQTDITQRKELEERLRHGEEMSLQLSRLAQIGAWEWDLLSGKLTWSPEMFRIHEVELGFEPLLENSFSFYPPEARRALTEAMEAAVRDATGFDLELPFTSARGRNLWVRVLGRAQVKDGRATRVYGAFQDITGRRDAEEMRRQLERQLFQAQKMETLGTLAGGIAHDFNNLLTGILGYQDLATEALDEPERCRGYLNSSREASMRARELVEQILTFSRQTGSEKVSVNLAQVVEESRRFLRATVPSNIRMEIDLAPDCGRVLADATQLHQVLLNLGSNAAHAMRTTGGTIRITLAQVTLDRPQLADLHLKLTPGTYARLDFSDNGAGMDEDTRKRIFDPFFTTKEVGEGTGLGLSVAHGIMQSHRGAITVQSTPGNGSTFTLYLPISGEAHQESPAPNSQSPFPRGHGEHIAVVDDEDVVRGFAHLALERNGYRVTSFDSPADCLEAIRRQPGEFRILLTDQTMPVMRGIELAAEVRAVAPDLPVIIMSGYFSRISADMLAKLGKVALLSKPFTIDELAHTMARALRDETPPS